MKTLPLLVATVFFALNSFAQNNSLGTSDPAAKNILDAVSAKFKTFKAVQAAFTLKVED